MKNNIYPCLWFNGQAKEAAELYLDVFGRSRILDENPIVVTIEMHGQKFCPTLMFTHKSCGKAEEAIGLYTSLFPDSYVAGILRYTAEDDDTEGLVKHAQFKLDGFVLMAMDSSYDHPFRFSEGISIAVDCNTQEEIDHFWDKLTADGGVESMCGWLKDKYGVSWQIVPAILPTLMNDPEKGQKVIDAFLKMRKFDVATLLAV
jgi:predicted 3-demethylubiquinone-9 3-methyltransferase (glyoxalase superfamily)